MVWQTSWPRNKWLSFSKSCPHADTFARIRAGFIFGHGTPNVRSSASRSANAFSSNDASRRGAGNCFGVLEFVAHFASLSPKSLKSLPMA